MGRRGLNYTERVCFGLTTRKDRTRLITRNRRKQARWLVAQNVHRSFTLVFILLHEVQGYLVTVVGV